MNAGRKPLETLIGVAGVLLFAAAAYYGWFWLLRGSKSRSAEELTQIALTASSAEQQQSAAVGLVQLGAPTLPQMRQVFHESQSREVRAQMILGLAQQWDLDSMPAFLAAMDDPSPLIRGRAEMAVKKILGTADDYRADDPPEERRQALQALRKNWDDMRASPRFPVYQKRAEAKRR